MAAAKKPVPKKKAPGRKAAPISKKTTAKKIEPSKAPTTGAHHNKKGADGLTQQQRLFVTEYLKDENGTQAGIRAGYSEHTAQQQASRLLCNVLVKTAIEQGQKELIAKVQKATGITLERTLIEIARGAFFDVRKLFRENGEPKNITELDDETASVIAGLDTATESDGKGEDRIVTYIRKYKLADRKGYLDMLMKHLGGYKKDNEQGGEATANALSALLGQMKRSALPVVRAPADE